jgi:hypothetical protein
MNPHPPQDPRPEEVTPTGALPRPTTPRPEPDSLRAASPARVTRPRGGGRSSRQRSSRPERAAAVYLHRQGCQP